MSFADWVAKGLRELREGGTPPTAQEIEKALASASKDGMNLRHVPRAHRTIEVKRAALEQNGLALKYLRAGEQTPELRMIAVRQNGLAVDFVDALGLNRQLALAAVEQNGLALEFIDPEYRTSRIREAAVSQNGLAIRFMENEPADGAREITPRIARLAVDQNPLALEYIEKGCGSGVHQSVADGELRLRAVKANPVVLFFINPYDLVDDENLKNYVIENWTHGANLRDSLRSLNDDPSGKEADRLFAGIQIADESDAEFDDDDDRASGAGRQRMTG